MNDDRVYSGGHYPTPTIPSLPDYPDWMADALCGQVGGDEWFPEKGALATDAKAVCFRCPVRDTCLSYALDNNLRFGVWGGMSEMERRKLRHQERGAA